MTPRKLKAAVALSTEQQLTIMRRALRHLIASYRGDEPAHWLRQILKGTYFDKPKGEQ